MRTLEILKATADYIAWVGRCEKAANAPDEAAVWAERVTAQTKAITVFTEAEALLPFFRDIAKTHALGDAGDSALARLIRALEVG